MSAYRNGYEFERTVAGDLSDDGYLVIRSGGSHGAADLVALKAGQVILVQCKSNGTISPADWNELLSTAVRVGAVALLALRPSRGVIEYRQLMAPTAPRSSRVWETWTADEVSV
jgi:Holliday junction resolvase